jgi:hypothetical protein
MNAATNSSKSYILGKFFSMPTHGASIRAIAVTAELGSILQSLYTLMLQTIVTQIWILIVLILLIISTRRRRATHNLGVANVAIWNSKNSPNSIAWAMLDYFSHLPRYAFVWITLAIFVSSGQVLFSSLVPPYLIVGQAAPVNPETVFVPATPKNNAEALLDSIIGAPAILRAVDSLDTLDPLTGNQISLTDVTGNAVKFILSQIGMINERVPIYHLGYSYSITGVDFGLQLPDASKFALHVSGSCYTEYDYFQASSVENSNITKDSYFIPCVKNDTCSQCRGIAPDGFSNCSVSTADSKAPSLMPFLGLVEPTIDRSTSNISFAFLVSSVGRQSYTESNDPWYETTSQNNTGETFTVLPGRPVLSCWQQDSWSYKDKERSVNHLADLGILSPAIQKIALTYLSVPKILYIVLGLGPSVLKSQVTGTLGTYFDANSSSLAADMERLVFASYIATKNTFFETTGSYHTQYPEIQNGLIANGSILDGAGDFIVLGSAFAALSLKFLITVPMVMATLFTLVQLLLSNKFFHWPWSNLNALNATILYSVIDSQNFGDNDEWKRSSTSPYSEVDRAALVRPKYHREFRSYGWSSVAEQ